MPDWFQACRVDDVEQEDVIPVVHDGCTYAVYCSPDGEFFATDGICTHEHTPLADGQSISWANNRWWYRIGIDHVNMTG